MLAGVLLAALLTGCRPAAEQSQGVQLIMGPGGVTPGMTLELRFEQVMISGGQVGSVVTDSPLSIVPPVAGKFTWLSPRSGAFTPAEPLALDTQYELTLRPGLKAADGQPVKAALRRTLTTPPFGLIAFTPQHEDTNATSEPESKLLFNASLQASEAARFIEFADADGQRIPADVRQGTLEECPGSYDYGRYVSVLTWEETFTASHPPSQSVRVQPLGPTNNVANLLIVTPRRHLPLGRGWKLLLGAGLPAVDGRLRLHARAEVAIGNVTPFKVIEATTQNLIHSGPSIQLQFSKPLPELLTNRWGDWVELTPRPTNLSVGISGRALGFSGDLKSQTEYVVKLRAGLPAAEPFTLAEAASYHVTVPPVAPRLCFPAFSTDQLAGGQRTFPLLAVNVPSVRVRAKLLDSAAAIYALRGYSSYFRAWHGRESLGESYQALNYNLVPGRTVFDQVMAATAPPDRAEKFELTWDTLLAGRKAGVVFLEAARVAGDDTPPLGTQALVQLTDLGLVWKKGQSGVEAFVFSHSTGRPVPGATTRLLGGENEVLQAATTDAAGLAHLEANTNAVWLAAQLGEDFHALELDRHKLWLYAFHLPVAWFGEPDATRRVMFFGDRNLYRPGETLHLKALVRDWAERALTIPAGLTGTVATVDARGRQFFQTNLAFNSAGAWSFSLPLPTDGPLGQYYVQLHVGAHGYAHAFSVQEFQPSAFELLLPAKSAFCAGEKVELPLSARYYFGKRLSRAQVKWSLEAEDTDFSAAGFKNFSFRRADLNPWFTYWLGGRASSLSLAGQGMLSNAVDFVIAPEVPCNPVAPQPRAVSLLVEVTDVNQQTLSRRVEFVRHSSDFYIGLRAGAEMVAAGKTWPVEAVAVRADGQPWPAQVKARLTLQHVEWQSVRVQGAGRTMRYRNEPVVTNVVEQDLEIAPARLAEGARAIAPGLLANSGPEFQGHVLTGLTPTLPGDYRLEVRAKDPGGREVMSSLDLTVSAPGKGGWDYRNEVHLTLKPGQALYAPGQTAEILVEAPISGTALVTVEREKVLRSFLTRLEGNAPLIRVPLEAGDAPNVFVGVILVRGSEDCPRKIKEPEYRVGYCQLGVLDPQSRLAVTVASGATNYLPGQQVEVNVEVKDGGGVAVLGAEVTLYAVDEGILSLMEHEAPDPHAFFYAPRPLAVQPSVSLPNLLTEDPDEFHFQNKGYLGGGGGNAHLRQNFQACAFWKATLVTSTNGRVSAAFSAPDGLTRYRVVAVACAASDRFGSGQSAFQVAKPLVIEPALPRFANLADRLIARGVVQNQTAQAGEVLVTLELDDKARSSSLAASVPQSAPAGDTKGGFNSQTANGANASGQFGPLARRVTVPARGSAVAEFPLEFTETGTAKWVWQARFADSAAGGFTDAVQSTLEVGYVAPLLRQCLLARITQAETDLLAQADPQLLAGRGAITVHLANTRLAELAEATTYLLQYPYGCVEQASSSLLPWILLRDAPGAFALLRGNARDMDQAIRAGVNRLLSMQTQSGGLGYWPGARDPMFWGSAYGGLVLALAQRHGVEVPKAALSQLFEYLSRQLRSDGANPPTLSDQALALYALTLAGRAEPAYHERLFGLREKLSVEDRALLALAIQEGKGPVEMSRALLSRDLNSVQHEDDGLFGCWARARAIHLLAWTQCAPEDSVVDRLVADLMTEQKEAHWGTTQGDAWALLALIEYARRVEAKLLPVEGGLRWGEQTVPFQLDNQTNVFTCRLAFTNPATPRLLLTKATTNRLYASLTLEARSPVAQQPRQDRGFGLQRRFERLDEEGRRTGLEGLRVGDRVLVTLRLSVRRNARFVAVDDALPSILEVVNPEFKTQETRRPIEGEGAYWMADFHEIRKDRFLSFADRVGPGDYQLRYVARVRAAGTVSAPAAKVEEMYHPERNGLTETQVLSSQPME